jgi:hypothetical protein
MLCRRVASSFLRVSFPVFLLDDDDPIEAQLDRMGNHQSTMLADTPMATRDWPYRSLISPSRVDRPRRKRGSDASVEDDEVVTYTATYEKRSARPTDTTRSTTPNAAQATTALAVEERGLMQVATWAQSNRG